MTAATTDPWQRAIDAERRGGENVELVIGVVTPVGTNTSEFIDKIRGALAEWHYTTSLIKLSDHFGSESQADELEDARVNRLIDAGNNWCKVHDSSSGVAPLAVELIRSERISQHIARCRNLNAPGAEPVERHAYVLHSLKRPGEINLLRWVYGERFVVIGTQQPINERIQILADRLRGHPAWTEAQRRARAVALIERDASETNRFGQDLAKAYQYCDIFVDTDEDLDRAVAVLFGDCRVAPTGAEHAMFAAWSTAARSLTSSRRVGAAIVRDGSILALGMNEVPSIARLTPDSVMGYDYSEQSKRDLASGTFAYLAKAEIETRDSQASRPEALGWIAPDKVDLYESDQDKFLADAAQALRDSPLANIIEFQRPVHAEMWALMDAARRGVSVDGAEMYCTTYPCHLCWKHVFACGVKMQYYIDIYPKSLASSMYNSTESMLKPYIGIAPTCFIRFFQDRTFPKADSAGAYPAPIKDAANPLARTVDFTTSDLRETSVIAALELQRNKLRKPQSKKEEFPDGAAE